MPVIQIFDDKPIDISSIKNKAMYEAMVRSKVKNYNLSIGRDLLEVAIAKSLTQAEMSVFCALGDMVGYNNMVYTTTKEIVALTGCVRQTVGDILDNLERKGLIKEVGEELEGKADRFILVNPRYFFKGYYPYREKLTMDWYKS